MKRTILLMAACLCSIMLWAKNGDRFQAKLEGGINAWFMILNEEEKRCQIGLGYDGYFSGSTTISSTTSGPIIIPETINGYRVTAIGWGAFQNLSDITEVLLPNTIKEIKPSAFSRCKKLKHINFEEGLTLIAFSSFQDCSSLSSITIPSTVQTINNYAFNNCTSLSSVTIDNASLTIGNNAFSGCERLTSFDMGNAVKTIGDYAFSKCSNLSTITLPESISQIGRNAFESCGLSTITIPGSVEAISQGAFYYCKNLTSATFGEGVKSIGESAFYRCSKLQTAKFPNSLESIARDAYYECASIKELRFPDKLESIGKNAFIRCTALTSIYFGIGLKRVESSAFSGCSNISFVDIGDLANWCSVEFDSDNERTHLTYKVIAAKESNPLTYTHKIIVNGKELDELIIPDGITKIGTLAFACCNRFDKLSIPSSVKSIGDGAFYNCTGMDQVIFKSSSQLETIGESTFRGCIGLTKISIPNSVTSLGASVFRNCTNLATANLSTGLSEIPASAFYQDKKLDGITIPETVKYIGSWAFYECSGLPRIDIPSNVEIIGTEAFCGCEGLKGLYIKDLTKWCSIKFGNYQYQGSNWEPTDKMSNPIYYARKLYLNDQLITDLVIPEGVETIEAFTFYGADIASLSIPKTVKTIGRKSFGYCNNLRSITLPNTIENIDEYSFAYLNQQINKQTNKNNVKIYLEDLYSWIKYNYGKAFSSLTSLTGGNEIKLELYLNGERAKDLIVPTEIVELGNNVFCHVDFNSIKLHKNIEKVLGSNFSLSTVKTIYSYSKFAPSFDNPSLYFSSASLTAIYVPKGRSENYKANWPNHAKIIFEMEELPSEPISFADAEVKRICVENWDTDGDGELSEDEAKAVTDLGTVFKDNQKITSFIELEYFTGLTTIGDQAFFCCKSLKSVRLPETVTSLGNSAFGECQLEQVIMPYGIKNLGNQVFADCKFTSITLPPSLEYIGYSCFSGTPIESIHIPASVNNLYQNPFNGCKSLVTITVDENNPIFYSPEGSNAVIMKETMGLRVACKTTVIPSDVKIIDLGAFEGVDFETIDIPESVTRIRDWSFRRAKIKNITIPESVNLIEQSAFYGCKNLTDVIINRKEPIAIEENVFSTRADVALHVPLGCKAAYEGANIWKEFKEITDEYTEGGASFASKDDGSLTLSNVNDPSAKVVIPSTLTVDGQEYSVKSIAESAFENSETLKTVSIPNSISEIGENAFAGCTNLRAIYNYAENPADLTGTVKALTRSGEEVSVAAKVFAAVDLESCVLYVPVGCSKKYIAAEGWNEFLRIIEMVKGDVNGNGVVNELDRDAIVDHIMGYSPEDFDADAADINEDGEVNVVDVVKFTLSIKK